MTTTAKWTKAGVLALAKKRWPTAYIEDLGRAGPSEDDRAAARARVKAILARNAEIKAELATLKIGNFSALVKAARFAVDVDGDDPSLPELRKQVEIAERYLALRDEESSLFRERNEHTGTSLASRRYLVVTRGSFASCIECDGDTLEQLAEAIQSKKA